MAPNFGFVQFLKRFKLNFWFSYIGLIFIILYTSSKIIENYFSKHIQNYLSNISKRLFLQCAQTTVACALITTVHTIHHEIMVQVSYLQYEQLEWAWRSVTTNIIITKYMLWMNVKLCFVMNTFLKIFSSRRIHFCVRTKCARPVESRGLQGPQLQRS